MLYRFIRTRIVRSESFDEVGLNFETVFKPQFRLVIWNDFRYQDKGGSKRSHKFDTVDGARSFLSLKTGEVPSNRKVLTVVE